jgi:hypothetical protein
VVQGVHGLAIVSALLLGFAAIRIGSGRLGQDADLTLYAMSVGAHAAVSVAIFPSLYRNMLEIKRDELKDESWAPYIAAYLIFAATLGGLAFMTRALVFPAGATIPLAFMDLRVSFSYILGFVAVAPGVIGLWFIQVALRRLRVQIAQDNLDGGSAHVLERLQYFWALARRVAIVLGAALGVSTLSTGIFRNAVLGTSALPEAEFPAEYTLFFGALLAAGLGFIYVPCHLTVQNACREFSELVYPTPSDPRAWSDWLTARRALEQFLGLETALDRTFPTIFAILAPFLGSAVSVLVSSSS